MKNPNWSAEEKALTERLINEGQSYGQVGKIIGRSRSAVAGVCMRMGIKSRVPSGGAGAKLHSKKKKTKTAAPRPERPPRPPVVAAHGVVDAVMSLNAGYCKWPFGDINDPEFRFCCVPTSDVVVSYCAEHQQVAYVPQKPRKGAQKWHR